MPPVHFDYMQALRADQAFAIAEVRRVSDPDQGTPEYVTFYFAYQWFQASRRHGGCDHVSLSKKAKDLASDPREIGEDERSRLLTLAIFFDALSRTGTVQGKELCDRLEGARVLVEDHAVAFYSEAGSD